MKKGKRYIYSDVVANRFYQMPKFLFEGEMKGLSNDARVLYSLLRDRHELSIQNKWINKNGEVYIIFSRETMATALGCSQPTLRKTLKELISAELFEEERQGMGKPNLIYLYYVDMDSEREEKKQEDVSEMELRQEMPMAEKNFQSRVKESFNQDCKNLSVKNEKNLHSRVKETFSQDCKKFTPNKTNSKETNSKETDNQSINLNWSIYDFCDFDGLIEMVKENLCYEGLLQEYKYEKEMIDGIIRIIVEVLSSPDTQIYRINQSDIQAGFVKEKYKALEKEHIDYVIECMAQTKSKIKNIRGYIISALYNAGSTMGVHNHVWVEQYHIAE